MEIALHDDLSNVLGLLMSENPRVPQQLNVSLLMSRREGNDHGVIFERTFSLNHDDAVWTTYDAQKLHVDDIEELKCQYTRNQISLWPRDQLDLSDQFENGDTVFVGSELSAFGL